MAPYMQQFAQHTCCTNGDSVDLRQEHEVFPLPNPTVLAEVGAADGVVYAMGSLYTSICPPLVLVGVGCAPETL